MCLLYICFLWTDADIENKAYRYTAMSTLRLHDDF